MDEELFKSKVQLSGGQDQDPQEQSQVSPVLEEIRNQTDGTPESIKKYFETLSFDGFSEMLNGLNAYFRRISGQHKMDGYGHTPSYIPPDPKDREPLLKEAFEKAIKEDSPEKCATVLGMSILLIHPYLDGNGRTSRTIFTLLSNGYSGSEKDKMLFSAIGDKDDEDECHHSERTIVDLDPGKVKVENHLLSDLIDWNMRKAVIRNRFNISLPDLPDRVRNLNSDLIYWDIGEREIENYSGFKLSNLSTRVGVGTVDRDYKADSNLTKDEASELSKIFTFSNLALLACMNTFSDELYNKSLTHINYEGKEFAYITYKNVVNNITSKELSSLRNAFRQARIDYVREMIRVTNRSDFQDIYDQYSAELEEWKKRDLFK